MASREYTVEGSQPLRKVTVRIGFPKQRPNDGRYECLAEIDDGESVDVKPMNGIDAFEALFVAIMLMGTELVFTQEYLKRTLIWMGKDRRDLAFPIYPEYSLSAVYPPTPIE
jgi:hypothetical protein